MAENAQIPKGAIVALIGGVIAFVGLFLDMVSIKFDFIYTMEASDSGIELLSDEGVTFGKYLPLIIAILGLTLAIFCIVQLVMASNGKEIPNAKVVLTTLAAIMLILCVVFLILVATKNILDWNALGVGEYTDEVRDLFEVGIGTGGWLLLGGSIVALVGAILGFFDNKSQA